MPDYAEGQPECAGNHKIRDGGKGEVEKSGVVGVGEEPWSLAWSGRAAVAEKLGLQHSFLAVGIHQAFCQHHAHRDPAVDEVCACAGCESELNCSPEQDHKKNCRQHYEDGKLFRSIPQDFLQLF